MCLLFLALDTHPEYRLIAAANRDEFYARPTQAMHAWKDHRQVIAGRDLEKGGTWFGVTRQGRWAAVTNYREPGEIVVAGDHVLPGYLNGVGDEETKFRVQGKVWHRTGDAGYLDDAGCLWLLGRCSARLNPRPGEGPVYPLGVEAALRGLPDLGRTAFVEHEGARILVVEGDPQTPLPDSVRAIMDRVLKVSEIPRDRRHNSKIDYPALRRLLSRSG